MTKTFPNISLHGKYFVLSNCKLLVKRTYYLPKFGTDEKTEISKFLMQQTKDQLSFDE